MQLTQQRAQELPAFARRPVLLIAAAIALMLLMASRFDGYWFDELYFIAAGKHHLAVSYADQPPLVPVLAALMDTIAPGSLLVLGLPAVLAGAVGAVLTALIARELDGGRRAQILASGAYGVSVTMMLMGHWLATYSIDPVWWILISWLLVRWVRTRQDHLLLWIGIATALSLQTKYLVVAFWMLLGISLLVCGPRELLRRPLLWAGAGIAALTSLPGVLWQAANGWPQLQMGQVVRGEIALGGGRPQVLLEVVLASGSLVGIVLAGYGLWRLLRAPELAPYRFLGVAIAAMAVVIVLMPGRSYYVLGLYPQLLAAGAAQVQQHRPARWWRWVLSWPVYAVSAAISIAVLAGMTIGVFRPLSDVWPKLATTVAQTYHQLPADEQRRTAVVSESYPFAAAIDHFGPEHGLPLSFSAYRGYGYFDPPSADLDTVLYVGDDPAALRPHFAEVRDVTPAHPAFDAKLWLCEGQRTPWTQLWPDLRTMR